MTHVGKTSSIHGTLPPVSNNRAPVAKPRTVSHRGAIFSRVAIVVVEIVNTAAIRMAYTVNSV